MLGSDAHTTATVKCSLGTDLCSHPTSLIGSGVGNRNLWPSTLPLPLHHPSSLYIAETWGCRVSEVGLWWAYGGGQVTYLWTSEQSLAFQCNRLESSSLSSGPFFAEKTENPGCVLVPMIPICVSLADDRWSLDSSATFL